MGHMSETHISQAAPVEAGHVASPLLKAGLHGRLSPRGPAKPGSLLATRQWIACLSTYSKKMNHFLFTSKDATSPVIQASGSFLPGYDVAGMETP
jgi:hypothetical protein